MIAIAPREILQQFTPGQRVTLGQLIAVADLKDDKIKGIPVRRGNLHPVPHIGLTITRIHSKYYYQNCCWVAMGKCDRCRAPDCTDRNWRKLGREVP